MTFPGIFKKLPVEIKTFGNSMYPLLQDGDVITIKKASFDGIKINDIICVYKNRQVFTHRVIYKTMNFLITKGDNNLLSDGKIFKKNIIGRLTSAKRGLVKFNPENYYLMQSTLYLNEIKKVTKELTKSNINFLFLKGLPIHLSYEMTYPRRIYKDCDLLIKRNNYSKLKKVLLSLGYKVHDMDLFSQQKRLRSQDLEVSFYKIINSIVILFDVHLEVVFAMTKVSNSDNLYPQKLINSLTDKFIEEKEFIKINGSKFPVLSFSNLFVYLALHLYHHNFKGSYRYDLIAFILRKRKVKYEEVIKTVKDHKLENFIFPGFLLLKRWYRIDFPKTFLDSIAPDKKALRYIKKNIENINIFDDKERISEGVERFMNLYHLSPNGIIKRITAFFSIEILYSAFWVMVRKIKIRYKYQMLKR